MSTKPKFYGLRELEKDFGKLTFASLVRSHRLCENMTLKEFSKILGMNVSSICDLEKGRKIPSAGRAMAIAKALGMSEKLFVQIAIQDQLNRDGLKGYKVSVA